MSDSSSDDLDLDGFLDEKVEIEKKPGEGNDFNDKEIKIKPDSKEKN